MSGDCLSSTSVDLVVVLPSEPIRARRKKIRRAFFLLQPSSEVVRRRQTDEARCLEVIAHAVVVGHLVRIVFVHVFRTRPLSYTRRSCKVRQRERTDLIRDTVTTEKIIGFIKQTEAGTALLELRRQHGFTPANFYQWQGKY